MDIIRTIREMRAWRKTAGTVAFVPTMGNLHEGHLALVREAKKRADSVAVSIFVNRLQFGQGEDFDRYPRTLQEDAAKLEGEGVSVLFAPDERELYPRVAQRYNIEPPHLQNELCGRFRPGHFRGVATVVAKLFNIVQPDFACFGKKDYQQLAVIKGLVEDLDFPVQIVPVDPGRAADGLALSSRNLQQAGWTTDYVEIRRADTLETAHAGDKKLVVLAAARLGGTRLIDNIETDLE